MSVGLFRRLWDDNVNNYRTAVAERWRDLHATTLSENALNARLDAYAKAFTESGAWQREYDKWNNNPVALQKDITKEVDYAKDWYRRNCANLDDNIFHGITAGIANVSTATATKSDATFNLMGQKVDDSYKGIVVKDGKKMLRK